MEKLGIGDASARLGIGVTTVKNWCDVLQLGNGRDTKGRRIITSDELALLEAAKSLRQDGRGLDTIQKRIGRPSDASDDHRTQPTTIGRPTDTEAIEARIIEAISKQTDLAERYARAAHEIGKLEAKLEAVESDRDRLAGLITDGNTERDRLNAEHQAERERMARDLANARAEVERLKARKWWRFW